jgi:hypothetical protein
MRFARSLLLVALAAPCALHAQRTVAAIAPARPSAANRTVAAITPATPSATNRTADSISFVVGKRVYLRSSGTFIGTIIDTDEHHDFRAGRFPRPWMKAVLMVRRDGPYEWMPVEGMARLYVAK